MKKWLLLPLLVCCFLCAGWLQVVPINEPIVSSSSDQCSCSGTYDACFTGEYETDHDNVCHDSGSGVYDATYHTLGGTVEVIDTGQVHSGSYALHISGTNDNIGMTWPNTGIEWEPTEGFLSFHIYFVDLDQANNSQIFTAWYNSQNRFIIAVTTSNNIYVRHEHSDIVTAMTTTVTVSTGQWYHIQVRWRMNSGTDEIQVRICSDDECDTESWESESDADALADFASGADAPNWGFGCDGDNMYFSVDNEFYIDDAYLWDNYSQS